MEDLKNKLPTPDQRPDLYDDQDYADRPAGYKTGVKTPDYIQKLIDAKQGGAKQQ